jgi:hypothetical protein
LTPDELKGSAPTQNLFHELLLLDTLHDLQNVNNKEHIYNIFKKELENTNIPKELKLLYLSSKKSFTRDAVDYIRKQHPVSMITSENVQNDIELQRRLESIMELNFVLDNIIAGMYEDNDMTDGTIGILGCAFILVLLANMNTVKIIKNIPNRRHQINMYDGLFTSINGVYMKRFMILFLKAAKRLSGVDDVFLHASTNVKQIWIDNALVPQYFNMCFPSHQVEIIKYNQIENIKIQNKDKTFKLYNIIKQKNNTNNANITYPHTKEDFATYVLDKSHQNNHDLWYLNFLRDAFKADVAVEKNYIYMTHDCLAHLYYKLIGGTTGFLLAIEKDQGQDEIKYTVSF